MNEYLPFVVAGIATGSIYGLASMGLVLTYKTSGLFVGCQAWTWNHFTVFEAIEKTADAGGKVIEFFPGQTLSKEEPTVKWDHNASAETIDKTATDQRDRFSESRSADRAPQKKE